MALLTVLLLVAVMAALAAAAMDDLRFGLRRSGNAADVAQARWYAIGAETFAALQLRRIASAEPGRQAASSAWLGRTQRFPIEGGIIEARLSDGGNCFNLNALRPSELVLETSEETGSAPAPPAPLAPRQLRALLIALETPPREAEDVVDAITDWIDADGRRTGAGWEDDRYAERTPAHRTGGALLAEVSEVRAIAPVTPEIYARMRPYVCAGPTEAPSRLNVNTLAPEAAVLLTMVSAGAIAPTQAQRLLAARPPGGWETAEAFWQAAAAVGVNASEEIRSQTDVRTRYFLLDTRVAYQDAEVVASALLEQIATDRVVTRARRWTRDE